MVARTIELISPSHENRAKTFKSYDVLTSKSFSVPCVSLKNFFKSSATYTN